MYALYFFSFYFWAKLGEEQVDERLLENQQRALRILAPCFASLSFFIIFSLQYDGIPRELIMLGGSLGYAACMILSPVLVLYLDKVAE